MGSLATKVSTEEILVFPFACEICHRSIFSKFDLFACEFYGIIYDMYVDKNFKQFRTILTCRLLVK